jgi:phosphatidyl-myo-inositol alpha-mannosyltransferase
MRIAQVLPYDAGYHGGVREVVLHLSRQLDRLGHQATIFGPTERASLDLDFPRLVPIQTNPVVLPANGSVARVIGLDPKAWGQLATRLRDDRFDVVHFHEPILWLPILHGLRSRSIAVGTFHAAGELEDLGDLSDLAWPMLSGLVAHLDATGQAAGLREYGELARPVVSSLLSRLNAATGATSLGDLARPVVGTLLSRLDVAIAVSNAARAFAASYGVTVGEVIPNGVDIEAFAAPDEARLPARDPATVLFFSRLDERKGLDTLLRAMPEVTRRVPAAELIVAGNFALSDDRAGFYRRLGEELGVHVAFRPSPDAGEKLDLFRRSTVLSAPAIGGESFGIILAEAMAAGLPIVASDIPGYRDVLEGGVHGVLVSPGDPVGLAEGLVSLLTDAPRRDRLTAEGRQKAATLAWDVIGARVAAVYEEARARRP